MIRYVIPAKKHSTRFPGKHHVKVTEDLSVIDFTFHYVRYYELIPFTIVVTDDPKIKQAAKGFGIESIDMEDQPRDSFFAALYQGYLETYREGIPYICWLNAMTPLRGEGIHEQVLHRLEQADDFTACLTARTPVIQPMSLFNAHADPPDCFPVTPGNTQDNGNIRMVDWSCCLFAADVFTKHEEAVDNVCAFWHQLDVCVFDQGQGQFPFVDIDEISDYDLLCHYVWDHWPCYLPSSSRPRMR